MILDGQFLRSCDDCKRWDHHDSPADAADVKGRVKLRQNGKPRERIPGTLPPCGMCHKVSEEKKLQAKKCGGHCRPEDADDPGPEHYGVVREFLENEAVRDHSGADPLYREHAAIVRQYVDRAAAAPTDRLNRNIALLLLAMRRN